MKHLLVAALLLGNAGLAAAQAMSLKDLPDESRAAIAKELARKRVLERQKQADAPDDTTPGPRRKNDECNLDIAAADPTARGARRNTTTVITGSVVQICGR